MLNYQIGLEKIVKKRIDQNYSYMQTLRELYGADPREVWNEYKKYNQEPGDKKGIKNIYIEFPEPHPAYSQWRMTPESTNEVLNKLARKNYEKVCFLGCPILGIKYERFIPKNSYLLDIDETVLKQANNTNKIIPYNIRDEIPDKLKNQFECVITDPPWYFDEIKLFTKRAAELAGAGKTIYLSMPGLLTRPSILNERIEWQNWLTENKLIIAEQSPIVEYEVPPFEYMAYKDIPAFTGETWRIGDWIKLKKIGPQKNLNIKLKQTKWSEMIFDMKRIFTRQKTIKNEYEIPRVSFIDDSLILKTVSKRSKSISKIDIWTSRNAVLHIDQGYNIARIILENIGKFDNQIAEIIAKQYNKLFSETLEECRDAIIKIKKLVAA